MQITLRRSWAFTGVIVVLVIVGLLTAVTGKAREAKAEHEGNPQTVSHDEMMRRYGYR